MVRGLVREVASGFTGASRWFEGAPRATAGVLGPGVTLPGDSPIPTASFRCGGCGFLESYARPEFAAE
jgi:hypothetical protein